MLLLNRFEKNNFPLIKKLSDTVEHLYYAMPHPLFIQHSINKKKSHMPSRTFHRSINPHPNQTFNKAYSSSPLFQTTPSSPSINNKINQNTSNPSAETTDRQQDPLKDPSSLIPRQPNIDIPVDKDKKFP